LSTGACRRALTTLRPSRAGHRVSTRLESGSGSGLCL